MSGIDTLQTRSCLWCSGEIVVVRRPGRPRLYCRQSCRQRAYERRAGWSAVPPIDRRVMQPNVALTGEGRRALKAYERGTVWSTSGKLHALRPAGVADGFGRRASLCGCLAAPRGQPFATIHPRSCMVCAAVAERRPIAQPLAPSEQLATLRAYLDASAVLLARTTRDLRRPLTPGERLLAALSRAA